MEVQLGYTDLVVMTVAVVVKIRIKMIQIMVCCICFGIIRSDSFVIL